MSGATVRSRFPVRRKVEVTEKRAAVGEAKAPSRLARMLALAHHVERLIEAGELESYSAAALALGITRARLTQVMNLLLLAPQIQDEVLLANRTKGERSLRGLSSIAAWERQIEVFTRKEMTRATRSN